MIKYRNISYSAKTFYGVNFEPGEIKSVPGYINCPGMVRVFFTDDTPELSKTSEDAPTSEITSEVVHTQGRGRKKKSIEPEKVSFAEKQETITTISEEETSNGNPS